MKIIKVNRPAYGAITRYRGWVTKYDAENFMDGVPTALRGLPKAYWALTGVAPLWVVVPGDWAEVAEPSHNQHPEWGEYGP